MISARLKRAARRALPGRYYRKLEEIYFDKLLEVVPYRQLLRIVLYGRRHRCPMCLSGLRHMAPGGQDREAHRELKMVGAGHRAGIRCPVCRSFDRERNIFVFLERKTEIFSRKHAVLHFAPERALQAKLSRSECIDYVCADLDPSGAMMKIDIRDIPFKDGTFDVVICSHVLEHVIEDRKAISEIFRVIGKGGWAIIQAPISMALERTLEAPAASPAERAAMFGQEDHVRAYGRDYPARLEEAGFKVEEYEPRKYATIGEIERFCLSEESVFLCSVQPEVNH